MDSGVKDIVERESPETRAEAPQPPTKGAPKEFNKKWVNRRRPVVLDPSATRPPAPQGSQIRHNPAPMAAQTSSGTQPPLSEEERIHLENIRKIQQMSSEEIEREREDIFRQMNPAILESLLKRAELKEAETKSRKPEAQSQAGAKTEAKPQQPMPSSSQPPPHSVHPASSTSSTQLREPGIPTYGTKAPSKGSIADWDPAPETVKPELVAEASRSSEPLKENHESHNHLHPDLDPSSEENSYSMHFPPPPEELRKFFPDLPVETEKLAWMLPIDDSEEAEYSSELTSLAPSELRFDFKGNLVTPRQSRNIPTTSGLHHHGDAPSAAGYTLPELAHLCRSSHPAQRSMAIQTAGRVLHKIRLRKFARSSDLQEGLDSLIPRTRIIETLLEAADESTRSMTVRTLATEALWLANTHNDATEHKEEN